MYRALTSSVPLRKLDLIVFYMKYKEEAFTAVIVGSWNHSIFSKEWVSKYLLDGENVDVNISTQNDGKTQTIIIGESIISSTQDLSIQSKENKFRVTAKKFDDIILQKVDDIIIKLTEYLPHTPVKAFGFNIGFSTIANDKLLKWFACPDDNKYFETNGFSLIKEKILRLFKHREYEFNVGIEKIDDKCDIGLNFHFEIDSLVSLKTLLNEKHFKDFKSESLVILNSLFNLTIDENGTVE